MEIKVDNGKLIVSIPLEEINNAKNKEKIGTLVGEKIVQLMQWVEDKEFRTKKTLKEKDYDQLIIWRFSGHTIDIKDI